MKNIGIISNLDRDIGGKYLAEVVQWLGCCGLSPIVTNDSKQFVHNSCRAVSEDELYIASDFIVTLGGDGTMLSASKLASKYNVPLMGINLGTLGYLTDVESSDGIAAIEKVIAGRFVTEKRMMLEARLLNENMEVVSGEFLALNDICVLRGATPRIRSFDLNINGLFLDTYKADGIIVATPTGSTAYNLAAGGPVLKPDIEIIAITPVCPHNMHSRPLVVSGADVVGLEVSEGYEQEVVLTLDGQNHIPLKKGQSVRVKKSQNYMTLIKTNNLGFYDILREKLR